MTTLQSQSGKDWLPNFLVIGAQKAGSSTLHDHLSCHPQIHMSRRKELHYFDDAFFTKTLSAYRSEFRMSGSAIRIGESTPSYLSYPGCAEKIRTTLGDIPLVVIVRDPISRMYSQYWHGVKYGFEPLSFRDAILQEEVRQNEMGFQFHRNFDYLSRSAYETHIKKYRLLFSSVHVCRLEDLSRFPLQILNEVYEFLGVEKVSQVKDVTAANPSKMARLQSINHALNAIELRVGANRLTSLIRRKNFYPFKYPKISEADRELSIQRLNDICPDTVTSYALR
jgi:hypothetical protein|tara:strand:+ start:1078 stop:1920 length:843 start_codon:yes stop_codon:yes gene_type:complete